MGVRLPSVAGAIASNLTSLAATLRDAIIAIEQLAQGRSNVGGTVTLTASATTTTVTHAAIGRDAAIVLTPLTASASTVDWYIPSATQVTGQFVIQHDSNPAVDRTFRWAATGG